MRKYEKMKIISIHGEANNKSGYLYERKEDKQYKTQPEFIDRNSNSKDKS